ncbi:ATP-binding protein [Methylocystis echinoides]|uniref:Histidine kinase/HSP90-like ATPase domain-containing protein n=1 Tax=Methylocystis echinoides TaxID=29468 RepID=A0A9W6GTD1_9HYPH|nr:ATP-binding protein [Methylocystis echinoides]GLI92583.1 hypothetical protein LMG27198_15750 [Methylocystis echinoides]
MTDRHAAVATALEMAGRRKEISVSEFFLKNRHLLGFDAPAKSLVTAVKEAVDNALDACEEAGVLPEITVEVRGRFERSSVAVEDNGPGIVEGQIARIFGKLLYGSKFHKLSQSRCQQGMETSAAGMYGRLTVGKPLHVISRIEGEPAASELHVSIDAANNRPDIHKRKHIAWSRPYGARVEREMEGVNQGGPHSVEFLVDEFSCVGEKTARAIIQIAGKPLSERSCPEHIAHAQANALNRALQKARVQTPRPISGFLP